MSMTPTEASDFDSPWKEALETYLEDFLAFFFPGIHNAIDWTKPPVFLDKEFQQVVSASEVGRRLVDKLVKVWRRDGSDAWVLVHAEIQNSPEPAFAQRMFVYNYRIFDRFERDVVSLAVLGDTTASWLPTTYTRDLWGCRVEFTYPVVKLHDYRTVRASLEEDRNPFAVVVLAHLGAQDTRGNPPTRLAVKTTLTRRLYERGYDRARIVTLYRLIDWLLELPDAQEILFWNEITALEEERKMAYVTSIERLSLARGRREGREEGKLEGQRDTLREVLEARFGALTDALLERLASLDDAEQLKALTVRAATAGSLEEFSQGL